MSIPTSVEFDEVISTLFDLSASELEDDVKHIPHTRESVIELIKKGELVLDRKYEFLDSLPASKWYSQQAGVRAARARLTKPQKKLPAYNLDEYVERKASYILTTLDDMTLEEAEDRVLWLNKSLIQRGISSAPRSVDEFLSRHNSRGEKESRFRCRLREHLCEKSLRWQHGIFVAFNDYFYTDRWKRLYSEARSKESDLRNALDAIKAISVLSENMIEPIPSRALSLSRIELNIKEQLATEIWTIYPLSRKDETSKERVLAFDLLQNNQKNLRAKRISIIYDLMSIDGIENPLEMRTLERLVSKWDAARQQYRQKYRSFANISAGAQ